MKKILTTLTAAFMAIGMNAQTITISSIDKALANDYAGGCEIDLDNDGLKELIVSGVPVDVSGRVYEDASGNEVMSEYQSWVLSWNGSSYTAQEFSQLCGRRSHIIPADFNGDGNIDLYIAGEAYDYAGVYLNDGSGNFTLDSDYSVKNTEGETIEWYPRAADIADFNLDGLPDLVTIGWSSVNGNRQSNCGVLINQGDGTFVNVLETGVIGDGETDFEMALCTVKAYDINMDGYPDFLLQGNVDNSNIRAYTASGTEVSRTFMAFANIGETDDGIPAFYSLEIATSGVSHQMGNGNFVVADFNNDGTPDIFVTGESPYDAFTGEDWSYYPQLLIGKVTIGDLNEVTYTDNTSFVARAKDIRPLNSNNVGVRAVDYNCDGYYDLFLLGWSTSMLDGGNDTQAGWLLPGSASGLTSYTRIPGASEHGLFFLDYGVQNALNYTFTGYHSDSNYFNEDDYGRSMVFTKNPYDTPSRPDAPAGLTASVKDYSVTLSWTAASTSMNNVTYEYYLKETTSGKIYNNVTSFIGGDNDGVRKVLREGNAYMNKTLTLTLADGTYEWGVQTVNAALVGSTFATGTSFTIGTGVSDGINTIVTPVTETARYNVSGQAISSAQKGINIVKMSNGGTKKVIVK